MLKEKIKNVINNRNSKIYLLIFILILLLNFLTITFGDDWYYMPKEGEGILYLINDLIDIYFNWSGRILGNFLTKFFLRMPKWFFNILNSVAFIILIIQMQKITNHIDNSISILLTFIFILIFVPNFGQTILWVTGASIYLWLMIIILAFIIPYVSNLFEEKHHSWILFAIFGIFAGNTNENTGGACILFVLLIIGYQIYKKIKIQSWEISGLITACVSFILNITAPGNQVRAEISGSINRSALYFKMEDLYSAFDMLLDYKMMLIPLLLSFGLIGIGIVKKADKRIVFLAISEVLCSLACIFAMVVSPTEVLWDRTMFGAVIFVLIAIITMLNELTNSDNNFKMLQGSILAISLLFGTVGFGKAIFSNAYLMYQYIQRENYVTRMKNSGAENIVIPHFNVDFDTQYTPQYEGFDLSFEFWYGVNKAYSYHHGITSVEVTDQHQWNQIYANSADPYILNSRYMTDYLEYLNKHDEYVTCVTIMPVVSKNEVYLDTLAILNEEYNAVDFSANYIGFVIDSNEIVFSNSSNTPFETDEIWTSNISINISSGEREESDTYVRINGEKYFNQRDGITMVTFNKETGTVVDCITWDDEFSDRGLRTTMKWRE